MITLVAHVSLMVAGVRITAAQVSDAGLTLPWHLLPVPLLRGQLVSSLLHLHSQPPAFNVATGLLVHLGPLARAQVANVFMVLCSCVITASAYLLLRELGVIRRVSVAIVLILVVFDPAQLLYGTRYFYTLPTAAIVSAMAWALAVWLRTRRPAPCAICLSLAALLVATNSSYQVYLVILALAPVLWVVRAQWRQVLRLGAIPLLCVLAWYANDAIQFGSAASSSWVGMNLARTTLMLDSPADLHELVGIGVLSPVALVRPFSCLSSYGSLGVSATTGVAALDEPVKAPCRTTTTGYQYGHPNFNNVAYVGVSRRYLSDDLRWIEHRPLEYLRHTTIGMRLWAVPAEQQFTHRYASWRLGGYTNLYDHLVDLEPVLDPSAGPLAVHARIGPGIANLSLTIGLITLTDLVVLPVALIRRRRTSGSGTQAFGWWLWLMTTGILVQSTLVEVGENPRFRFELGILPIVGVALAVLLVVRAGRIVGGAPESGAVPPPAAEAGPSDGPGRSLDDGRPLLEGTGSSRSSTPRGR